MNIPRIEIIMLDDIDIIAIAFGKLWKVRISTFVFASDDILFRPITILYPV